MGRSLSIGSPLLKIIRRGVYRSSSAASLPTLTDTEIALLSELSPRLLAGRLKQVSECLVTVTVYSSLEMLGASVVRTTCLTMDGKALKSVLTEFALVPISRLSELLRDYPSRQVRKESAVREFTVWTSPAILHAGLTVKRGLLSRG